MQERGSEFRSLEPKEELGSELQVCNPELGGMETGRFLSSLVMDTANCQVPYQWGDSSKA